MPTEGRCHQSTNFQLTILVRSGALRTAQGIDGSGRSRRANASPRPKGSPARVGLGIQEAPAAQPSPTGASFFVMSAPHLAAWR